MIKKKNSFKWSVGKYLLGIMIIAIAGGCISSEKPEKKIISNIPLLVDDISLTINGGENIIKNGNFSDKFKHWVVKDDTSMNIRKLNYEDYHSAPCSLQIDRDLATPSNVSRTYYSSKSTSTEIAAPIVNSATPWIEVNAEDVCIVNFWHKGSFNSHFFILGLEKNNDWYNAEVLTPGNPTEWTEVSHEFIIPQDVNAIAVQFDK